VSGGLLAQFACKIIKLQAIRKVDTLPALFAVAFAARVCGLRLRGVCG